MFLGQKISFPSNQQFYPSQSSFEQKCRSARVK